MACAFMLAAVRHEAETYFAQGLYQDAMDVYDRLLLNSNMLESNVKIHIQRAKDRIRSAAMEKNMDEGSLLSEVEITRIKKGWACRPSGNDLAVSAGTLIDLGRFESALEEYRFLLISRHRTHTAISGVTICLLHLIGPDRFVDAVDLFSKGIFRKPDNRVALKLQIAKHIDCHQYPHQFSLLYKNLTKEHPISPSLKSKIRALGQQAGGTDEDAYGPTASLTGVCGHPKPHSPGRKRELFATTIDGL